MAEIQIRARSRDGEKAVFEVRILENREETIHEVSVKDSDFSRITGGTIERQDLVKKSFEYLLEREPKESILQKFDLMEINKYFPEYENDMTVKL